MPADSSAQPPRFRLWLRRQSVSEGPYALRFEVTDGKGILRVARPGVLIDPPARPVGMEERLSQAQLRSTRFILVWDGGRARQGHLLNRLDEAFLERLESDRWLELEIVMDSGFRYAVLDPSTLAPASLAREPKRSAKRPSLNELRQALDSLTVHGEDMGDPDSALDGITGPPLPPTLPARPSPLLLRGAPEAEPPRGPARSPNSTPSLGILGRGVSSLHDAPTVVLDAFEDEPPPTPVTPPPAAPLPTASRPPPTPDAVDEALELGEAADDDADAALAFGEAPEPASDAPAPVPEPPPTIPAALQGLPPGAAAFFADFADEADDAAFSVDLPRYRRSTEHVVVRPVAEPDGAFARDELPPLLTDDDDGPRRKPRERIIEEIPDLNPPPRRVRAAAPLLPVAPPPLEVAELADLEAEPLNTDDVERLTQQVGPTQVASLTAAPSVQVPDVAAPIASVAAHLPAAEVVPAEAEPLEATPPELDPAELQLVEVLTAAELPEAGHVPEPSVLTAELGAPVADSEPEPTLPVSVGRPPLPPFAGRELRGDGGLRDHQEPQLDASGVTHRSQSTLVRHLRRQLDDQRLKVLELELRVAELTAALAAAGSGR